MAIVAHPIAKIETKLHKHQIELHNLDRKLERWGGNPRKRARQEAHRPALLAFIERGREVLREARENQRRKGYDNSCAE